MKATWLTLFTIICIHLSVSDGKLHSKDAIATRCVLETQNRIIDITNAHNNYYSVKLRLLLHAVLHEHKHLRVYVDDLITFSKHRAEILHIALVKLRNKTEKSVHMHAEHNDKLKQLLLEKVDLILSEAIEANIVRNQTLIGTFRTACDKVEHDVNESIPTAKWLLDELIVLRESAPPTTAKLDVRDNFIEVIKGFGISNNEYAELKELTVDNERDDKIWKNYIWKRRGIDINSARLEIEDCLREHDGHHGA